jgi:hypothetical protein
MVLTVSFVLSSVTMLGCHRRSSDSLRPATLAPASERQDHTTSPSASCIIRPRKKLRLTLPRPSHPAPNVRDDREAPLLWERDRRKEATDLGSAQSGIFLQTGLDDPNRIESLDEIAFYARGIFSRPSRADGATFADIDSICSLGRRADQRQLNPRQPSFNQGVNS